MKRSPAVKTLSSICYEKITFSSSDNKIILSPKYLNQSNRLYKEESRYMIKKIFVVAIIISLLVSMVGVVVGEEQVENDLLEAEEIQDWNDLDDVSLEDDYVLMNDLDEDTDGYDELVDTEDGWEPIGDDDNRFTGTFDGNGHKIADLYIGRPEENEVGLFGAVGDGAIIEDVCIADADVTGNRAVGTLIGRVTGTRETEIKRCCAVDGSVVGSDGAVGGLIGSHNSLRDWGGDLNDPKLLESFAEVDVSDAGEDEPDKYGGLVGCSQKGAITNSYALGDVTVTGDDAERIGGLAGCLEGNGEFKYTYSTGEVTVTGINPDRVGALTGNTEAIRSAADPGEVYYSYSNEETSGQKDLVGTVGEGIVDDSELFEDKNDMTGDDVETNMDEFDFDNVWKIVEETDGDATDDGYPILRNSACDRETQLKAQGIFEEKDIKIWIEEGDAPAGAGKPGETVEMDSRVHYQATTEVDIAVSLDSDFGDIGVENLAVENHQGDFVYFSGQEDSVTILKDHNPDGEESLNRTWKVDIPYGVYPGTYSATIIFEITESESTSYENSFEEDGSTMSRDIEFSSEEKGEDNPQTPSESYIEDVKFYPLTLSWIAVILLIACKKWIASKKDNDKEF